MLASALCCDRYGIGWRRSCGASPQRIARARLSLEPAHASRLGKRFGNWSASPCRGLVAPCFRGLVHGDAVDAWSGVRLALEMPDHMQARVHPIEAIPVPPRLLPVEGPYLACWTFTGPL